MTNTITVTIPHGMTTRTIAEALDIREALLAYLREIAPDVDFKSGQMIEVADGKDDLILTVNFGKDSAE